MKWQHPVLGFVAEMNRWCQEVKGWKHLYAPSERWEQLIDEPLELLHSQARASGCPAWEPPGRRHPKLSEPCRRRVYYHHDQLWRDVYGAELMATTDLIGRSRRRHRPIVLASPRGVWFVLEVPAGDAVFDVYRPHKPGEGVDWTEADFAAQARGRFRRETGMMTHTLNAELARQVQRPVDAWHLALAVGAARAASLPELREALADAEARLGAIDPQLRRDALPHREALLDTIEQGLNDESEALEEATVAVLAAEDALVATELLAGPSEAQALRDVIEDLVAWAPQAWLGLDELVRARGGETVGVAQAWWRFVDDVLGALMVSAVEPVRVPRATLAVRLTAPPWWQGWAARLDALGERVKQLVDPGTLHWDLAAEDLSDAQGVWDLVTDRELSPTSRVYVVEGDEAEDVTDDYVAGQPFWQLENPGQEAYVLLFDGLDRPLSLDDALRAAADDAGIMVTTLRISRPS
jgi:hypothetical protein